MVWGARQVLISRFLATEWLWLFCRIHLDRRQCKVLVHSGIFFCLSTAFLEKFKTATHIYDEEAFNAVLDRVYSSYINLFDNFKMALEVFQTLGISKAKLAAAKRLLSTCRCF